MLPAANHPTWAKLIKGETTHQFTQASASMLFFNLQREYKKDPAQLHAHIAQARKFFEKYQAVLAADIQRLFK